MAELTETLVAASQANKAAEARLNEWLEQNYGELAKALAAEIAADGKPEHSKQLASLYLKNTLNAKSQHLQTQYHDRWKSLDAATRQSVKDSLLAAFRSAEKGVPHFAAVAAAEIASVELPFGEWAGFVDSMTDMMTAAGEPQQHAALECLGFTCERIDVLQQMMPDIPDLQETLVDKMLTTIVHGVQKERSVDIRFAALTALKNSLAFVHKNMQVKTERDFIMNNAICEAVSAQDPRLRRLAFESLDQVAELYYEILQDYMTAIYQLTVAAIQGDAVETVKMAAIEFWSTLAWMEQQYLEEEEILRETGEPLDRPHCPKYVQSAMQSVVPLLLETLSRQGDDVEDDDEWNLRAAGAVCLESFALTVKGLIVATVMPFVQENIGSANWRLRDAAIVAFANILDGPPTEEIGQYVNQSISVLLQAFQDPNEVVRDSATHCISNICKLHIVAVQGDQVHAIIQGLISKLSEKPQVAAHASTAIYNLARSLKSAEPEPTNLLTAPMLPLMQELLKAMDRNDAIEANLRGSSMSAAGELIDAAAADSLHILRGLLPEVTRRIEDALKREVLSNEDREIKEQMLGQLSGILTALYQKLGKADLLPHSDTVMQMILQVLQMPNSICQEEALLTVGAAANALEEDFAKYLHASMPFIIQGLRSFQVTSLVIVSVGVVVDICTAVGNQIQPFCDQIMSALADCLKDGSAHRDTKPVVIACFGDVAMAIGAAYEPYIQVSTMLLMQAASAQVSPGDDDLVEFINGLRLAVLEAYTGIILGLSEGNKLHIFYPNITSIMQFVQYLSTPASLKDDSVLQKVVALVGDIAQQMGSQPEVRQQINQQFVVNLVQEAERSSVEETRDMATWTRGVVQQVITA